MTHIWKRSISMLLALVMVFGMLPTVAFAEGDNFEEQSYVEEPVAEEPVAEEPAEEEPAEETPVEEEPVEETPVEEEPAEETPVEEEPAEETPVEEEPAEEPAAEEPVTEQISFLEIASEYVANVLAMTPGEDEEVNGYVWLDRNRSDDEITDYISMYGLRDMILNALDEDEDLEVAFNFEYEYKGVSGTIPVSMDAPPLNITPQEYAAWEHLGTQVTAGENIEFTVTNPEDETSKDVIIGFRSINRVRIRFEDDEETIEAETYDAGAVKAASAYFQSADCMKIEYCDQSGKVEETIPADVSGVDIVVADASQYWPEDGLTETVDSFVKATIVDSMDGKTKSPAAAKLVLVDTTAVYVVQYTVDGDTVSAAPIALNDADLEDITTVATPTYASITGVNEPTKQYYKFAGWTPAWNPAFTPAVEDSGYIYISYEADWNAVNDRDADGIPDELDTYKVTYSDGRGGVFETYDVLWGNAVPVPAGEPEGYEDNGTAMKFAGWAPDPVGVVTDDMTFTATWTGKCRVYFFMHDGTKRIVTVEKQSVDGGEPAAKVTAKEYVYLQKLSAGTWYSADEKGNKVSEEPFDFSKTFTEDVLYLVGDWVDDRNENGMKDGTPSDPIQHHIWLDKDGGIAHQVEWVQGMNASLLTYNGYKPEGYYVAPEWQTEVSGSAAVGCTTYTHTPVVVPDKNGNTIDDAKETIVITTEGAGEVTANAANIYDAGNGTYIYDSRYDGSRNITITAKPVVNDNISESYVSKIEVGTTERGFTYNKDYSVTYPVVATPGGQTTVKVTFAKAERTPKNETMQFIVGITPATVDGIYEAAIADPAGKDENGNSYVEELKYLARAEGKKPVSVADIRDTIANYELSEDLSKLIDEKQFLELKQKALNKIDERAPGGTFEIELDAVWLDLSQEITSAPMDKVISEAKNEMMVSVTENPYAAVKDMDKVFDDFTLTINAKARMAECHPFGENVGTEDTVTEVLKITYANEAMCVVQEVSLELEDKRTATMITANDMVVDYGADVSPAVLLANAKLTTVFGRAVSGLELDGDYTNLVPGITHTIFLKYAGDNEYKGSTGSFKLTINKSVVTVGIDRVVYGDKAEEIAAKAKPQIKNKDGAVLGIDDITGVHIVAGYDMTNVKALDFANGKVTGVEAFAWIHMSENAKSLLSIEEKPYPLDELKKEIEKNETTLSEVMDPAQLQELLNALDTLQEHVEGTLNVKFTNDPYPKNPGVYLNMVMAFDDLAITIDGDNKAFGLIAYHPAIYIPNNGIELTYNGVGGHKLEIPSDAKDKSLTVMANGAPLNTSEYSIYYIGMTGDGETYMSSKAPTADGIYLASAVDLRAEEEKISTDCAVVTIGMEQGKITVDRLTIEQENPGAEHRPVISVNKGAATTIISGTVGIDNPDELKADMTREEVFKFIQKNFYGTVHMEIPDVVFNKLNAVWEDAANKAKELGILEDMPQKMPTSAKPEHLIHVLKYIQETNNNLVEKTLGKFKSIEGYVDKAMEYVNGAYNKLIAAVELLPDDITVSLGKEPQSYSAAGVYAYIGVVTDPAFVPDMGAGLLVIENAKKFELTDDEVTYDGGPHILKPTDEIQEGYLTIVRERDAFNLILDSKLEEAIVKKLAQCVDKEISSTKPVSVSVNDLYAGAGTASDKLTRFIMEWVSEKAEEQIRAKFDGKGLNTVQTALETLEKRLIPAAKEYLTNKFKSIDGLTGNEDIKLVINGTKPTEIGTYEIYAVSYGVAVESATLKIVPREITEVVLKEYKLPYTGAVQNAEIQAVKAGDEILPEGAYTIVINESGTDVGKYKVSVTAAEGSIYQGTAEATWEIVPAAYTVIVENSSKIFGAEDPAPKVIVKDANGKVVADQEFYKKLVTIDREQGEDVNTYNYLVTEVENDNYDVTVESVGTLEIVEAVASVEFENVDADGNIIFGYDAAEKTVAFKVTANGQEIGYKILEGSVISATDAGTYYIKIEVDDPNYSGSWVKKWTIAPAEVTIKLVDETITYGETFAGATKTYETGLGDDVLEYTTKLVDGTVAENAGTYKDVITAELTAENSNYKVTFETADLVIEPVKYNVVVSGEKYYGEQDPTPVITVTDAEGNVVTDQTVIDALKITAERQNTNENAGTYYYTVTKTDNANYQINVDLTKSILTIKAAELVLVINDATMKATDEIPALTWTLDTEKSHGAVAEDVLKNAIELTANIATNKFGQYLASDEPYPITGAVKASSDNWKVTFVDGKITVTEGDYVCWNMQTGKYYYIVMEGLAEAEPGHTVQMLKDTNEIGKNIYSRFLSVESGVSFDLNTKKVTVDYVVGYNGSTIYDSGRRGMLIVPSEENLIMSTTNTDPNTQRREIGFWTGGGFMFGSLRPIDNKNYLGLTEENGVLSYRFELSASTEFFPYMQDDGTANNLASVLIRLTWDGKTENGDTNGIAYQNYVYNNDQVHTAAKGASFTFTLADYGTLQNLTLTAYVLSETGVEVPLTTYNIT